MSVFKEVVFWLSAPAFGVLLGQILYNVTGKERKRG